MSAPFYHEKIAYFKLNEHGKDYVIGDVHGRYDLVYQALEQAGFNKEIDRLFCVGDLIDRGQFSEHVLEFLQLPFVYAVRGNHEDMLLELYDNDTPSEDVLFYYGAKIGLHWWLDVSLEKRVQIIEALRKLPLVMEIETKRGHVGLVHADVGDNLTWEQFKEKIEQNDKHVIEEALWGRTRLTYDIKHQVEGIGRIYVGHTVQDNIRKLGNVVAIDTGAVFDQHLTMADLVVGTQMINNVKQCRDKVLILQEVTTEPVLPFGEYVQSSLKDVLFSKLGKMKG